MARLELHIMMKDVNKEKEAEEEKKRVYDNFKGWRMPKIQMNFTKVGKNGEEKDTKQEVVLDKTKE